MATLDELKTSLEKLLEDPELSALKRNNVQCRLDQCKHEIAKRRDLSYS